MGDLRAGSSKISLAGDMLGALKGQGVSIDVNESSFTHSHGDATAVTLFTQTANANFSGTASETTLVGTGAGSATLAANYLAAGKTIRLRAWGYYSTKGAAAGLITFRFKLGTTVVVASAAVALTNGETNVFWRAECELSCRSVGATGTVFGQGWFSLSQAGAIVTFPFGPSTGTATIDTTATQAVSLTAQFGTADASNGITCTNLSIEGLN